LPVVQVPASGAEAGAALRRSWGQRLLISFNLAVIAALLAGVGGVGYFYWRFDHIPRVSLHNLTAAPKGDPQNYLLVGSDSRDCVAPGSADDKSFGDTEVSSGSGRSDTTIVVRVDPKTSHASMVSFPRDLWVEIPGHGHAKINTAFLGDAKAGISGPDLLIATIKLNFGIEINHYAQVDFCGFRGLVNAIGGVTIYLPAPVRDWDTVTFPGKAINQTGLNIRQTGCVQLDGDQALAYVRSRHFQSQLPNGRWVADPTGDFGRISRQQDFIRRAVNKVISQDLYNPIRMQQLASAATDRNFLELSTSLKINDMVKLAKGFKSLSSGNFTEDQIPVVVGVEGSQSTVEFQPGTDAEREAIFDVYRGIDPTAPKPPPAPSSVTVRVLNGSGVAGQAGDMAVALRGQRFGTLDTGNSARTSTTVIRYGSGQEGAAQLLSRYLVSGATLQSEPTLKGVDLLLVTGTDFAGVLTTPRTVGSPLPTTTTTTPVPTSTTIAGTAAQTGVPDC
jgi:LCP family protein required for cell wall assembly